MPQNPFAFKPFWNFFGNVYPVSEFSFILGGIKPCLRKKTWYCVSFGQFLLFRRKIYCQIWTGLTTYSFWRMKSGKGSPRKLARNWTAAKFYQVQEFLTNSSARFRNFWQILQPGSGLLAEKGDPKSGYIPYGPIWKCPPPPPQDLVPFFVVVNYSVGIQNQGCQKPGSRQLSVPIF